MSAVLMRLTSTERRRRKHYILEIDVLLVSSRRHAAPNIRHYPTSDNILPLILETSYRDPESTQTCGVPHLIAETFYRKLHIKVRDKI
jgi:hypothetical protein